mgnify:CR=1 FL=1
MDKNESAKFLGFEKDKDRGDGIKGNNEPAKYEFYRRNQVYESLETRIKAGQFSTGNFYQDLMVFGKNVLGISDFPAVPEYLEKEQNIEEVIGSLE